MSPATPSVLVPLDGSKNAENALPGAAMLSRVFDLALEVVHVLDPAHDSATLEAESRAFDAYGRRLADDYALDPDRCRFQVFRGAAAETILGLAAGAIWIAMSTHGRGGFRAMFIGSVADKVVRGTPVPMLLVPGVGRPPETPSRVLVALDGSAEAERALEPARRIGRQFGAHLTLLRAYSLIPPVAAGWEAGYPSEVLEIAASDASTYLARVSLAGEETVAVRGDPTRAITTTAAEIGADLVVLTASGKGLAGRLALGSTTDRVMHTLHRPLIIMPPTERSA